VNEPEVEFNPQDDNLERIYGQSILKPAPVPTEPAPLSSISDPAPLLPPVQIQPIQVLLRAKSNISASRTAMASSFGNQESIITSANLVAITVKEMVGIIQQVHNDHAPGFISSVGLQITILGNTTRNVVANMGDKILFNNWISVVDVIISIIDQYVPYFS